MHCQASFPGPCAPHSAIVCSWGVARLTFSLIHFSWFYILFCLLCHCIILLHKNKGSSRPKQPFRLAARFPLQQQQLSSEHSTSGASLAATWTSTACSGASMPSSHLPKELKWELWILKSQTSKTPFFFKLEIIRQDPKPQWFKDKQQSQAALPLGKQIHD